MRSKKVVITIAGIGLWLGLFLSTPLLAQPQQPMFPHDGAKTVFGPEIFIIPSDGYALLRPPPQKGPDTFAQQPGAKNALQDPKLAPLKLLTPQEEILQKYGDPLKPHPVLARKNAPKPYRAMLEAMQIGDDELAFKYAVQYERYKKNLQDTINKAVAYEGQAMMRDDVLPPNAWPSGEAYKDYHYLQTVPLGDEDQQKQKIDPASYSDALDAKARALIAKLKQSDYELFKPPSAEGSISKQLNEKEERQNARLALKGRVPIDPKGEVNVMFFFRPYDKDVIALAPEIERFYKGIQNRAGANFAALTMGEFDSTEIDGFVNMTKVTFPIISGKKLALQLNANVSPTMIFMSPSTGRSQIEEGLRNFYYLDELLNIMQGK